MYCVYKHTNISNGKVYIGMTGKTMESRWKSKYPNNPHFNRAIRQYGESLFKHEVIADNLTKDEAELLERKLISEYDSTNPQNGYNIELGGNHNGKHSKFTLEKMSKSQKGRVLTEEHRKKISDSLKGRKLPPNMVEARRKRMIGNAYTKGVSLSEEHKKKISESCIGKGGKKVVCINDGNIYDTITEAAKTYDLKRHSVLNICRGKTKKIRNSDLRFAYCERR